MVDSSWRVWSGVSLGELSVVGVRPPASTPAAGGMLYVASVAVRGLAIALAHELAPDVRINGVAPGGTVGTDLRGPAALGLADQSSAPVPAATPSCRSVPPLQITLAPADHAASYVFLASDRARGHHRRVPPDGDIGIKT